MLVSLASLAFGFVSATLAQTYPPGPRLIVGFQWIISETNTYMQGSIPYSAGPATLGPLADAGQFIISSGGLIQITSQIPNLEYVYTNVDETTGAISFEDGDVPPAGHGIFDFVGSNKALTYTTSAGVPATGFLMCGDLLFVDIPGVAQADDCTPVVISSLKPEPA